MNSYDRDLSYLRDLIHWRSSGTINGIQIKRGATPCALCLFIEGCYRIENPPTLPTQCEHEWGCTVWWECIFSDETPKSPWRTEDTPVNKDEIRRGLAVEQCVFQIDQCLKLLSNPKTKPKTRTLRLQILRDEIGKLEQLDPVHQMISVAKQSLG